MKVATTATRNNQRISITDKKKPNSQLFHFTEVVVPCDLFGKIDTSKWVNQANIITPEFKRASKQYSSDNYDL